jgi:SNF family Na+-dependent transporter
LNWPDWRLIRAQGLETQNKKTGEKLMPTLFRFVVTLTILAGIVYGAMFALAMFIEPRKAEMSVRISPEKLNPKK